MSILVMPSYGLGYLALFKANHIAFVCFSSLIFCIPAYFVKSASASAWLLVVACLYVILGSSLFVNGPSSPILFWLVIIPLMAAHLEISLIKSIVVIFISYSAFLAFFFTKFPSAELNQNQINISAIMALLGISCVNLTFKYAYDKKLLSRTKEKEKLQEELIEKQRMASIASILMGVSHDFNNFLHSINQGARGIRSSIDKKSYETANDLLADIEDTVRISSELIKSLNNVFEIKDNIKTIYLYKTTQSVFAIHKGLILEDFNIEIFIPEDMTVEMNEMVLYRSLSNLIKNAAEASLESPKRHIIVSAKQEGKVTKISVKDHGTGISDEAAEKIFTSYSSKEDGLGIGLKNIKELLNMAGHKIYIADRSSVTEFCIEIHGS